MATKDTQSAPKKGLLGWLRSQKQAEETASVPPVKLTRLTTPPTEGPPGHAQDAPGGKQFPEGAPGGREFQRDVAMRHVDKGEIARGGMGSIRKVYDTNLLRTVAMKVLFDEHRANAKNTQRFVEEAQIMGQLEHPNIVPVHELGEDEDGTRYFTMLYVRGKTLTDMLSSDTVEHGSHEATYKFLNVFLKVCDAVAFAHSRGVIHRDLKPDNIMVGGFGEVYLMDWGIAKLLGAGAATAPVSGSPEHTAPVRIARAATPEDEKGQIIGTFFYMAPEQAQARVQDIDFRTDVFLLGGVLFEILTGQPPYMGATVVDVVRQAQACAIPEPQLIAPERNIPQGLSRICMKCLAKAPEDRFQSVLELQAEIEQFLKGGASFPSVVFKAGEHLMKEGEKGDNVFIVKKGMVQVYKTFDDGKRQGLATLGPGAVVGEAAVLSAKERTASVVAIDDVTVTAVSRTQLDRELGFNSWMGSLVKALAERFVTIDQNLGTARNDLQVGRVEMCFLEYLYAYAEVGPSGFREAETARVVRHVRRELKLNEADVLRVLNQSSRLVQDAERGTMWCKAIAAS